MYLDVLDRSVVVVRPHGLQALDRLHPRGDAAEDGVLAVEERRGRLTVSIGF
jgi:hypothetical protein